MEYNALMFVDIETVPSPSAEEYLPAVKPPAYYKDADKILDFVLEKRL